MDYALRVYASDGQFAVFNCNGYGPIAIQGEYWHTREALHARLKADGLQWIGKRIHRADGKPCVAIVRL